MKNIFKKGVILGGILAVIAAVGFAVSKDGQDLGDDMIKDLKPLASNLKKSLHKLHDVTKENFDELVVATVKEYSKNKEITDDVKKALIANLQTKWFEMEEEYQAEKLK